MPADEFSAVPDTRGNASMELNWEDQGNLAKAKNS